jgi:D-3-phosphoglycerate dehydrogenase
MPSVSREDAPKLLPWGELAVRLGSFLAQVEEKVSPKAIEVECVGEPGGLGLKSIAAAALAGFLSHYLETNVNQVAAAAVAADRGIWVRDGSSAGPRGKYASMLIVRAQEADGTVRVVEGTLGMDGSPRLVKWGDLEVEAPIGGPTMVLANLDKPGVIGFIGTTLGDAGVNVAGVHLGVAGGGRAASVWSLNHELPHHVLDMVRRSGDVLIARALNV